jgi:hypothetical protein
VGGASRLAEWWRYMGLDLLMIVFDAAARRLVTITVVPTKRD